MTLVNSLRQLLALASLVLLLALCGAPAARAAEPASGGDSAQVLQGFVKEQAAPVVDETTRTRQKVMFLLGIPVLLLLLITAGLGLATGLLGKQLFVMHMLFAGLSLTLAIVHAIVGLIWFFPF